MRGIRLSMAPIKPANSKPTPKELAGSARASDAQTACDKEAATKVIRCRERQLYEKVRQGRDRHLAANQLWTTLERPLLAPHSVFAFD